MDSDDFDVESSDISISPPTYKVYRGVEKERPKELFHERCKRMFTYEEGKPCKNRCLTITYTLLIVFGVVFAFILSYCGAMVLFSAWFPKYIYLLPRIHVFSTAPEPTSDPLEISAWGVPYDEPCGGVRKVLMRYDCMIPMEECEEEKRKYEEDGVEDDELFWNITKTCYAAAECLNFLACREADQIMEEFGKVPHEFFMTNGNFSKCMVHFYRAIREDSYDNCTQDYDFLSKSYKLKNRAYVDGRECFMNFVWEKCHESVFDYLATSYQPFLQLATIPSDSCGTFQKIEALECRDSAETFKTSVNNLSLETSSSAEFQRVADECDLMQHCYSQLYDRCIAKEKFLVETKEYCVKMHFLSSPLIQCLQRLKKDRYRPDLRKYPCFIGHDFNDESTVCIRFRDSKRCVQRIMVDYCGPEVLEGFDGVRSYLLEMWDC